MEYVIGHERNLLVSDIPIFSAAQNDFLWNHFKGQIKIYEVFELLWAPEGADGCTD
jgi:hypothetical protein